MNLFVKRKCVGIFLIIFIVSVFFSAAFYLFVPTSALGDNVNLNDPITFESPLTFMTVENVLTSFLTKLQGIIVTISLIFIVIGALLYMFSAGNEQKIETAKKAIFASLIGLAIGVAAPTFLKEIADILGWENVPPEVQKAKRAGQIALDVLNFLLSIIGGTAIIQLVWGGIGYLTSGGNEEKVEAGKKNIIYALLGLGITLASLLIIKLIVSFFSK